MVNNSHPPPAPPSPSPYFSLPGPVDPLLERPKGRPTGLHLPGSRRTVGVYGASTTLPWADTRVPAQGWLSVSCLSWNPLCGKRGRVLPPARTSGGREGVASDTRGGGVGGGCTTPRPGKGVVKRRPETQTRLRSARGTTSGPEDTPQEESLQRFYRTFRRRCGCLQQAGRSVRCFAGPPLRTWAPSKSRRPKDPAFCVRAGSLCLRPLDDLESSGGGKSRPVS